MDIIAINDAIDTLEESPTTLQNITELASLYICKSNLEKRKNTPVNNVTDGVEKELDDILPYYIKYKEIKRRYQLNQTNEGEVIQGIKDVCRELTEFIQLLYRGTDMNKERICIRNMINDLSSVYCIKPRG